MSTSFMKFVTGSNGRTLVDNTSQHSPDANVIRHWALANVPGKAVYCIINVHKHTRLLRLGRNVISPPGSEVKLYASLFAYNNDEGLEELERIALRWLGEVELD